MDDIMRYKIGKKVSSIALFTNIFLMISKALIGYFSHSKAVMAEAFNNGTDIFATIVVFSGLKIAYMPPDENHHYGHAKAEPIVSKIVALIIIVTAITIGWDAIRIVISKKLQTPELPALFISSLSVIIKYFLFRYTNKMGKLLNSSSLIADSYNHRSDVFASLAAALGVTGARIGFPFLDPIAGIIVSILIFRTGIMIYLSAINDLMDTAPDKEIINSIKEVILNTDGVIELNNMKIRKHGAGYLVDLEICVEQDLSVKEGHEIANKAKDNIISKFESIKDVMVHINPCKK